MELVRNLRNHKVAVFVCFVLLIAQAYCDLSLPNYTSDIVDVGIQQKGVEHVATDELSERTFDLVCMMVSADDESLMRQAYALAVDTYCLTDFGRDNREAIDNLMALPLLIIHTPESMAAAASNESSAADAGASTSDASSTSGTATLGVGGASGSSSLDLDQALAAYNAGMISKDQVTTMMSTVSDKLSVIDDSLLTQQAITSAQTELEELGYNLDDVQMDYLMRTGGVMVLMAGAIMLIVIIVTLVASRTAAKVARDLRSKFFARVLTFSEREVNSFSAASLITRGTNDIQLIQMITSIMMRMILYAPILAVGGIFMVATKAPSMAWIVAIAVIVLFIVVGVLMVITMPKFKVMQKLIDRVNLIAREILTGLPVIRAFGQESHEQERFEGASGDLMRTQLFTNRVMTFMMPIMTLVMNFVSVGIIWFGGISVSEGTIQTGDLIALITYSMVIIMGFLIIGMVAILLPRASVAAGRVREVIETESSIRDPEEPKDAQLCLDAPGVEISFDHVSFAFDEHSANAVEDATFTFPAGKTSAIVGPTGCGKSTLLKLALRYYDVSSGTIRVDGVDVRDLTQAALRSQFGYVPQKAFLFSGDIESNVAYGLNEENSVSSQTGESPAAQRLAENPEPARANESPDPARIGESPAPARVAGSSVPARVAGISVPLRPAEDPASPDASTSERIEQALSIAQASDFVNTKEEGLRFPISQGGTNVSGGQRQRLAIARALALPARGYLFDDSFSALDYKTDAALRSEIADKLAGRTVVIVAQRISTIMNADHIVVLDEGRVVGQGTHAELLANCPTYLDIAQSQLSEEELATTMNAAGPQTQATPAKGGERHGA